MADVAQPSANPAQHTPPVDWPALLLLACGVASHGNVCAFQNTASRHRPRVVGEPKRLVTNRNEYPHTISKSRRHGAVDFGIIMTWDFAAQFLVSCQGVMSGAIVLRESPRSVGHTASSMQGVVQDLELCGF